MSLLIDFEEKGKRFVCNLETEADLDYCLEKMKSFSEKAQKKIFSDLEFFFGEKFKEKIEVFEKKDTFYTDEDVFAEDFFQTDVNTPIYSKIKVKNLLKSKFPENLEIFFRKVKENERENLLKDFLRTIDGFFTETALISFLKLTPKNSVDPTKKIPPADFFQKRKKNQVFSFEGGPPPPTVEEILKAF